MKVLGRIMGLDYGTRRIGVALSDPLHLTAQPYDVIDAGESVDERLREIADRQDVERVVVGLPVGLSGREGPSAEAARRFAERAEAATGRPVEFSDERFTSRTAQEALIAGKVRRDRRKGLVDKVAAAVMLQQWLDRHARG